VGYVVGTLPSSSRKPSHYRALAWCYVKNLCTAAAAGSHMLSRAALLLSTRTQRRFCSLCGTPRASLATEFVVAHSA
jgi:NADH pyrophosphatase NudC (nudix superfamily)